MPRPVNPHPITWGLSPHVFQTVWFLACVSLPRTLSVVTLKVSARFKTISTLGFFPLARLLKWLLDIPIFAAISSCVSPLCLNSSIYLPSIIFTIEKKLLT